MNYISLIRGLIIKQYYLAIVGNSLFVFIYNVFRAKTILSTPYFSTSICINAIWSEGPCIEAKHFKLTAASSWCKSDQIKTKYISESIFLRNFSIKKFLTEGQNHMFLLFQEYGVFSMSKVLQGALLSVPSPVKARLKGRWKRAFSAAIPR